MAFMAHAVWRVVFIIVVYLILFPALPLDCSVLQLYIRGVGGQELQATLLKDEALSSGPAPVPTWSTSLPQCVTILLSQLYPTT